MSNIPGLSVCPVDEGEEKGIEIPSFSGTVTIPESHRYGNCRSVLDFERLATINEGKFGVIYKCRDKKANEIYALKKFKMTPDIIENGFPIQALREMHILSSLKHTNIVNSHGSIAGKSFESNFVLLDYCVLSLHDLIEKGVTSIYEREVVKYIMKQIFQGLEYIHEGLIIHRDINCRNIIFTEDGVLKLCGFRTARFYSKGDMTPGLTELPYRAPELLFRSRMYGPAVDMWSTGCLFAKLLLRKLLFNGNSEMEVLTSIFNVLGPPSENIWPGFNDLLLLFDDGQKEINESKPYSDLKSLFAEQPKSCQDLIQELIVYFPNARISAKDCLKTAYFRETPRACSSEYFVSIIKSVPSSQEPMDVGK